MEFKLGLNIVPFPGLARDWHVDGFLTFIPDTIYVDQRQMETQETRYRFTLAHEVGHWILHRDLYNDEKVSDLEAYLRMYEAMDDEDLSACEFQARNLGGRILLPRAPFLEVVEQAFKPLRPKVPQKADTKLVCGRLAKVVAPRFNVHEQVIETRLFGDGLCEEIGLWKTEKR